MLKKQMAIGIVAGMTALWLCGCNNLGIKENKDSNTALTNETVISISKEGKITTAMAESFGADYYQQDELQNMILSEAAAYNAEKGEDCIGVEKVQTEKGIVNVIMKFDGAECYADYKETTFFVGTIAEAKEKGLDLNVICHEPGNPEQTIDKAQIEEMEKNYIVITDEPIGVPSVLDEGTSFQPITVETFGKVLYVSEGVVQGKNKNSVRIETEAEGLSYIIFK